MARNDVLIIGAGPSGLFAAAELARHGVKARLVEREVIDAVLYDLYLTFDSAAGDEAAPNRRWRRRSMPTIDDIWLAALTKDEDDAGSKNRFNLTVNIDGADAFRHDFLLGWNLTNQGGTGLQDGQAGLEHAEPTAPFDANQLTNSSVRLGLRGDDAWAPKHVMVIGRAQEAEIAAGRFVALAMATDIERRPAPTAERASSPCPCASSVREPPILSSAACCCWSTPTAAATPTPRATSNCRFTPAAS